MDVLSCLVHGPHSNYLISHWLKVNLAIVRHVTIIKAEIDNRPHYSSVVDVIEITSTNAFLFRTTDDLSYTYLTPKRLTSSVLKSCQLTFFFAPSAAAAAEWDEPRPSIASLWDWNLRYVKCSSSATLWQICFSRHEDALSLQSHPSSLSHCDLFALRQLTQTFRLTLEMPKHDPPLISSTPVWDPDQS